MYTVCLYAQLLLLFGQLALSFNTSLCCPATIANHAVLLALTVPRQSNFGLLLRLCSLVRQAIAKRHSTLVCGIKLRTPKYCCLTGLSLAIATSELAPMDVCMACGQPPQVQGIH